MPALTLRAGFDWEIDMAIRIISSIEVFAHETRYACSWNFVVHTRRGKFKFHRTFWDGDKAERFHRSLATLGYIQTNGRRWSQTS